MSFDNIIGHENIKRQIVNSYKQGRFTHAHIFTGPSGIGKSILAKETAKLILNKDFDKTYADFFAYRVKKDKLSIGIKEIMEIIDEINKKPYEGEKKVILIHDADKMTEEAQNAFLKTIEEPPIGVYIILLCENTQKMLNTIMSRCTIHMLGKLSRDEIILFIKRKYPDVSEEKITKLAAFSDGIPGEVEKFIEDDNFKNMRNTVLDICKYLKGNDIYKLIDYEKYVLLDKNDCRQFLAIFLSYIRDMIIYKETLKEDMIMNFDKADDIEEMSEIFSLNKMYKFIELIDKSAELIGNNVNVSLVLYTMLYKMQEV